MNQGEYEKLLIETHTNSAVAANGIKNLEMWSQSHEKQDDDTRKKVEAIDLKVSRIIWTWGIATFVGSVGMGVIAIPRIASALGLI